MELTHASFFSGVGGLDLGLERAGFRTVSFSEIDPYASAALAERWPRIPNLGDIVGIADGASGVERLGRERGNGTHAGVGRLEPSHRHDWRDATLWTGGFPCQDLSVAGKRAGFAGARSSLAFAFLDLVERYRPPAIVLENVPGLLSSHKGRDFHALQRRMAQLGYVGAYRVLDARHFGVPQRRRRVFIVALDAGRGFGPDSAAEVLSVGSRCRRHPPAGTEAWAGVADGARPGVDIARAVTGTSGKRHDDDTDTLIPTLDTSLGHHRGSLGVGDFLIGPPPDAGRVRAPDGLAGGLDDRDGLAATLNSGGNDGGFRTEPGEHLVLSPTLRVGPATPADGGPGDTVPIVVADTVRSHPRPGSNSNGALAFSVRPRSGMPQGWNANLLAGTDGLRESGSGDVGLDRGAAYLPLGLDSHRYRCCGNGVVASVSEWIGYRLASLLASIEAAA